MRFTATVPTCTRCRPTLPLPNLFSPKSDWRLCYRCSMPQTPESRAQAASLTRLRIATVALCLALVVLGFTWETVLAPLRPGGSLLALKVLPLALVLPAFWLGRIRHYQLWSMLILVYLCEGVVRGMTDRGLSSTLGWVETALAVSAYAAILRYVQLRRRAGQTLPVSRRGLKSPPPPAGWPPASAAW